MRIKSSTSLLDSIDSRKDFEDKEVLNALNKLFEGKRKKDFKVPAPGGSALLLVSGGLDSISLWFTLLNTYQLHVYPLYCYVEGKENNNQINSISFFSSLFKKRFPQLHHDPVRKILSPSFSFNEDKIDLKMKLPLIIPNLYKTKMGGIRATIINNPTRMLDYLSQAISHILRLKFTKNINISTIFLGYVPEDGKATREPTLSLIRTLNLSLNLILGDFSYKILAPIDKKNNFYYAKSALIKLAVENGLPIEKTWSCMEKNKKHQCGICPSCVMRREAFKDSGCKDKTTYSPLAQKVPLLIRTLIKKTHINIQKITQGNNPHNGNIQLGLLSQFEINPQVSWNDIGGLIYRFHPITGELDSLNETGSEIWRSIYNQPGISLEELTAQFVSEYSHLGSKALAQDLKAFLKLAIKEKYIFLSKK